MYSIYVQLQYIENGNKINLQIQKKSIKNAARFTANSVNVIFIMTKKKYIERKIYCKL